MLKVKVAKRSLALNIFFVWKYVWPRDAKVFLI